MPDRCGVYTHIAQGWVSCQQSGSCRQKSVVRYAVVAARAVRQSY
jgi:hypothetical protein